MKTIPRLFALVLATAYLTGCFPYRYPDSLAVDGRVVDARSHRPVRAAVASVDARPKQAPQARTAADGTFSLPPVYRWILLIPGTDFSDRTLIVKAEGYQPARVPLRYSDKPIHLDTPIALQPEH